MSKSEDNVVVTGQNDLILPPARFYRPELDALRFIAFLLVFCCHSLYTATGRSRLGDFVRHVVVGGSFGVDLFFILSAYLITELFRREKKFTGSIDIRGFYVRRILRIWPLYFGFVLIWFMARTITPPPINFPFSALLAFLFLVGNWYMVSVEMGSPLHSPVVPLWSVCVEEQFYLAWPLVVRFANKTGIVVVASLLCLSSYMMQLSLFMAGAVHTVVWCNSLVHGEAIGIGVLSAVLLEGRSPTINKYLRFMMFLGALILFGVSDGQFHFSELHTSVSSGMMAFASGSLGAALLFFSFLGAPQDGLKFLTGKALTCLGRISYGLYVIHVAVLDLVKFVFIRLTGNCSPWTRFSLALPITFALAWASYRWYESPFLALKQRFSHVESGAPVASCDLVVSHSYSPQ